MSEFELSMSVPLDSDGFLRRQCPTCERQFKWKSDDDDADDSVPAPEGGYFCPYCAVQAQPGSWFTEEQVEHAKRLALGEHLGPALEGLSSAGGGLIEVEVSGADSEPPRALEEVDDMRRVSFECHPEEPVKVLEDWDRQVHCLLCGAPTAASDG